MDIGIALFDGGEELDFAGPWEVLAYWSRGWPADDVSVFTIADNGSPVHCSKGLRVLPDRTWDEVSAIDVVVYPGGRGTRRLPRRFRKHAQSASPLRFAGSGPEESPSNWFSNC
jgi:putative intracellular protease/amidase